jgi:transposase InsO family protein
MLGVSTSGFYAAEKRGVGKRGIARERLRLHVRAVFRKSQGRYGSPRVHQELRAEGLSTGRRQVEQVMRAQGLFARPKRRFLVTTDSSHEQRIHPNLLERNFAVEENREMDRVWVGDITYLPTREGWLYLAVVLDLASRSVVGWAMKDSLEAELATAALERAIWSRRPAPGLIHHSDRGGQYASGEYQARLAAHGIRPSMSRKGNCWDNAVAESFFATLEKELIQRSDWQTRAEARRAVVPFIEIWYNRQRRHSSLGYRSPAEYEEELVLTRRAA